MLSIQILLAIVSINILGKTNRLALIRQIQLLLLNKIVALTSSIEKIEDTKKLIAIIILVEQLLRKIQSEVLDILLQDVIYSTIFFSFNEDSIIAIQIVLTSRARNILVTVCSILSSQTISKLATQAQRVEAPDFTKMFSSNSIKISTEESINAARTTIATDFPLAHLSNSNMLIIERQYLSSLDLSLITKIKDILFCLLIQQDILLTQLQLLSIYCIQHIYCIKLSNLAN